MNKKLAIAVGTIAISWYGYAFYASMNTLLDVLGVGFWSYMGSMSPVLIAAFVGGVYVGFNSMRIDYACWTAVLASMAYGCWTYGTGMYLHAAWEAWFVYFMTMLPLVASAIIVGVIHVIRKSHREALS